MSVEAMAWALNRTDVGRTDKLVLIGIANHDGDGGAWPSIETLARYGSVTPRNARAAVRRLEALGLVTVHRQEGGNTQTRPDRRPNLYELHQGRGDADDLPRPERGDDPDGRGDAHEPDGGMPASSEPSLNHPEGTTRGVSSLVLADDSTSTVVAVARHRIDWTVPQVMETGGHLDDALLLCVYLARQLRERGIRVPESRPLSKGWVEPMEAMLRMDGRHPGKVVAVLDWLNAGRDRTSVFWRANVLSPVKLRERWDQMAEQYRRDRRPGSRNAALADDSTPMSEILDDAMGVNE